MGHEIHGQICQICLVWEEDLRGGERGVAAACVLLLERTGIGRAAPQSKSGRAAPQPPALP